MLCQLQLYKKMINKNTSPIFSIKNYITLTKNSQGFPMAARKDWALPVSSGGIESNLGTSWVTRVLALRSLPLLPAPPHSIGFVILRQLRWLATSESLPPGLPDFLSLSCINSAPLLLPPKNEKIKMFLKQLF